MHDKGIGPHKTQFKRDENYGNEYFNSYFVVLWYIQEMDVLMQFSLFLNYMN